jgi:hypothetical protein
MRATGGNGSYNYTLTSPGGGTTQASGGSNNVTFSGLSGGVHTATITSGACTIQRTFTVEPTTPTGNPNVAPDVLLNILSITPSGLSFPSAGSVKTITYTIANSSSTAAQGVILTVTKPFSNFSIELGAASQSQWEKLTEAAGQGFSEFRLRSGSQVLCGQSVQVTLTITRGDAGSGRVPITANIRFQNNPQDLNELNNTRAVLFDLQ